MSLRIVHIELDEANALVASLHRHHKPVTGHRFSLGLVDNEGKLRGAAIVGRPVARKTDYKTVLEVTRLVTDGTRYACSALYSAAARCARELGYEKIQTFILESEPGTSLKAAGWTFDGMVNPPKNGWKNNVRPDRRTDQPLCDKQRWVKVLRKADQLAA